jgi:hypothetical protein
MEIASRFNGWTHTLYAVVQSLSISKRLNFGNLDEINESINESRGWIKPCCSFTSSLRNAPTKNRRITFRKDPAQYFNETVSHVVRMLLLDLVVIFDDMMGEKLIEIGQANEIEQTPGKKLMKLYSYVDEKEYGWAINGCFELIAVRNALCHNDGVWNKKSLDFVNGHIQVMPVLGEKIVIGLPMLFLYKKAIRTFINQIGVSSH